MIAYRFARDFLAFINRGNVIDLAVAVVIGGAFSAVINAVVELFTTMALTPTMQKLGVDQINQWPAGFLLVAIINFLVVSVVIFLVIKAFERFKRQSEDASPDTQMQLAEAIHRLSEALETRQI